MELADTSNGKGDSRGTPKVAIGKISIYERKQSGCQIQNDESSTQFRSKEHVKRGDSTKFELERDTTVRTSGFSCHVSYQHP
jgi:hypothetical protein